MSPFLTQEELAELTGYRQRVAQARWLDDNRYPYQRNARGRLLVLREEVSRRLTSPSAASVRAPRLRLPA